MDVKGYTDKFICGCVGFIEEFGVKDVVKIANKISKMKEFKRVLVRRVSERCWGVDFVFVRKNNKNKDLDEVLSVIKKVAGNGKVNRWDVSGDVVQIKPKVIR
ncbi:MAG: hypothetical protein OQK82_00795 [Candidatus Pacearchaeota archaeon]|nr:hypothetical protein [Candidatus Pacearchaeota archaeon]